MCVMLNETQDIYLGCKGTGAASKTHEHTVWPPAYGTRRGILRSRAHTLHAVPRAVSTDPPHAPLVDPCYVGASARPHPACCSVTLYLLCGDPWAPQPFAPRLTLGVVWPRLCAPQHGAIHGVPPLQCGRVLAHCSALLVLLL